MNKRLSAALAAALLWPLLASAATLPSLEAPGGAVGDTYVNPTGDVYVVDLVIDAAAGKYVWDEVAGGGIVPGPADTDGLPEGALNLYSTPARTLGTDVGDLPGDTVTPNADLETALGELEAALEIPAPADAQVLGGAVDADALLAALEDGQAYHFQSGAEVVFSTANNILSFVDGNLSLPSTTFTAPAGVQGFLTRQANGDITLVYTTQAPHGIDSDAVSGTVDTVALMADVADGQAFHFHAFAETTFEHPTGLGEVVGDVPPLFGSLQVVVPAGTQGFLRKFGTSITVYYAVSAPPGVSADAGNALDLGADGLPTYLIPDPANAGQVAQADAIDIIEYTAPISGEYAVHLCNTDFTAGSSYMQAGLVSGGASLIDNEFDATDFPLFQERATVTLAAGEQIFVSVYNTGAVYSLQRLRIGTPEHIDLHQALCTINAEGGAAITSLDSTLNASDDGDGNFDLGISGTGAISVNEYANNLSDFRLVFAHEDAGSHPLTVTHNGVPATFENLENATDGGAGLITFASGVNQVFNRSASTVEVAPLVGDVFTITTGSLAQFETIVIGLTDNATNDVELDNSIYRLRFTGSGFLFIDRDNVAVASGAAEAGTYTITRTLNGWTLEKAGAVLYDSPVVIRDYSYPEPIVVVEGATGAYRIGLDQPAAPFALNPDLNYVTGHDLTQAEGMTLKLTVIDNSGPASQYAWATAELDVDSLLAAYNAGFVNHGLMTFFNSDYVRVRVIDPATGELEFADINREFKYVKTELWITAPNANPLFEVANTGTITATATFQNLGDLDTRITGADGDEVTLEYGDGNRDTFVFLDGIAKSERKGGGATDTELQVVGDQLQVRTVVGASGITKAWYKQHINAGVIAASGGDTDTEILRHRATAVNVGGQPAGNALFQIETGDDVTQLTDLITYSAGVVSGQYPYDIEIVADFRTLGTGAASRVYHFRDVLAGDAAGDVSGTSGVFGQGSAQTPARVTVPANTAFSYDVRSVSSEQNQSVQIGNSLYVTASDVSHEEAVTERLSAELYINAGPFGGTAPPGAKLGIDTVNSVFYIVNGAGNWEALP